MGGGLMRLHSLAAAGLAATALVAGGAHAASGPPASLSDVDRTGYQLVNRLLHDLQTGDKADLNRLLAPSFLRQRADGTFQDKAEYMASPPPVAAYSLATSVSAYFRGAITTRWEMAWSESSPTIAVGAPIAPQLTTFAWTRAGWRVTSQANFATASATATALAHAREHGFASSSGQQAPVRIANPTRTGTQLVDHFMGSLKAGDEGAINRLLAPSFMVQRSNGSWSPKSTYLINLPKIASYDIGYSEGRYSAGMLSVRWTVATSETLPGVPVGTGQAPRLSTFVWTPHGWRMTSHANLNPPTG